MPLDPADSAGSAASDSGANLPLWLTLVVIALSFYGALRLDPFGIGSASSERSQQAALRVTAPFYAPSGNVVAVLVDDEYLSKVGQVWPLSYGQQGRLLRSILDAKPAVVFLDVLYRQRHGREDGAASNDPLQLVAPIPSQSKTRLIFAAQMDTGLRKTLVPSVCPGEADDRSMALSRPDALLPPLKEWMQSAESGSRARVALLGWWGCKDRYPLVLPGQAGTTFRTPAMAMLEAWCEREPGQTPRPDAGCKVSKVWEDAPPVAPMVIRWGGYAPEAQRPFYAAGTCQQYGDPRGAAPSVGSAVWMSIKQFAVGLFEDLRERAELNLALPCPAVTVLPASLVRFGDREQVNALLADKIVVLGVRASGVPDWHQSPVHGQVAGALLHAMAADNLLALGGRYVSELEPLWGISLDLLALVLIAVFLPAVLDRWPDPKSYLHSALGLLTWSGVAIALALSGASGMSVAIAMMIGVSLDLLQPKQTTKYLIMSALLAAGTIIMMFLGWAPTNWIGLILVILAFIAAAKPYVKAEERKFFPNRWSLAGLALTRGLESFRRSPLPNRVADVPAKGE